MTVRNLDYECFINAFLKQRDHQEDWLKSGYAPKGFYLKDFSIIKAFDSYHLIHIAGTPGVSCCLPGNELWFGHATTQNFVSWQTHKPCFYIDPNGWDCGHVIAPYLIEADDHYWMFYTGCSIDNTQRIGLAKSVDLYRWQRISDKPIIDPNQYDWAFCPTEQGAACRDPHVIFHNNEYSLYYTAVTKNGLGCVARASSIDLRNWKDNGPVYRSDRLDHCESSNVQKLGDNYLLFFGGQYEYWSYVVSDNPYQWPAVKPTPLARGITAMEVIKKKNQRWLVSYFKQDNYRLFIGVIDWRLVNPAIEQLVDASDLREFL